MKLNEKECLAYLETLKNRLEDLTSLSKIDEWAKSFKQLATNLENSNLSFDSTRAIKKLENASRILKEKLPAVEKQLEKAKDIISEAYKNDLSNSYLNLLSTANSALNGRKLLLLSEKLKSQLSKAVECPLDYSFLLDAIGVLDMDLEQILNTEKEILNPIIIFDSIKEITTNMLLLGANGSGKSRFSRSLAMSRQVDMPITIIPAQHYLGFNPSNQMDNVDFSNQIRELDNNPHIGHFGSGQFNDDFGLLIKHMQTEYNYCARQGNKEKSLFSKVSEIFSKLIKNRKLEFDESINNNIPVAATLDGKTYSINEMSDGEKAILYFIVHILVAKEHSFIVVDEPENHLHYDVCYSLWNELEKERSDCTFLYLTHNIDFALSRKKCAFIWNKSFSYPNSWDIEKLDNNEIPKQVYFDILGIVPPILFCEGEPNSIDRDLYAVLYPNFIVRPCGSCEIVKQYKLSLKKLNLEKNKEIYAIVDRDFKTDDEIKKAYIKNGISVLRVLEAENLLFVPEIAKEIFKEQYSRYLDDYFKLSNEQIGYMINKKLKAVIKDKVCALSTSSFFDEYKNNEINLTSVKNIKDNIQNDFQKLIDEKDYEESLIYFDLKNGFFALANKYVDDYMEKALNLLSIRLDIREAVAKKYVGI